MPAKMYSFMVILSLVTPFAVLTPLSATESCAKAMAERCRSGISAPKMNPQELQSVFDDLKEAAAAVTKAEMEGDSRLISVLERLIGISVEVANLPEDSGTNFANNRAILASKDLTTLPRLELIRILAHELGHSFEICTLREARFDAETMKTEKAAILAEGKEILPGLLMPPPEKQAQYACLDQMLKALGNQSGIVWQSKNPAPLCASAMSRFIKSSPFANASVGVFKSVEICYDRNQKILARQAYGYRAMSEGQRRTFVNNSTRLNCVASYPSEWLADVVGAKIFARYLATHDVDPSETRGLFVSECASTFKRNFGYPDFAARISIFAAHPEVHSRLGCQPSPLLCH